MKTTIPTQFWSWKNNIFLCSKYDLYSKSKVQVDVEKVKPYYLSLIEKVAITTRITGSSNFLFHFLILTKLSGYNCVVFPCQAQVVNSEDPQVYGPESENRSIYILLYRFMLAVAPFSSVQSCGLE